MRVCACVSAVVALVVSVACQRTNQGNTNTRDGLLGPQIGLPPVPGAGPATHLVSTVGTGCYCAPINQRCIDRPFQNVRIANQPTSLSDKVCTTSGQKVCCTTGSNPVRPVNPNPFPVRPNPVIPNPTQIGAGRCGVSNPIPYRQSTAAQADFGEYPWMVVLLEFNDSYLGGGVLISSDWVLTAAHKVSNVQSMKVRLGEYDVTSPVDHPQYPHIEVIINRIIIHPAFNANNLANDVALLRLSQSVNTQNYPHIGPACLPEAGQIFPGQSCWVTGWGKDSFTPGGQFQSILKEVDVPVIDPFVCESRMKTSRLGAAFKLDQFSFMCAGGVAGKDACTGDGGAPLVCRTSHGWTVAGLVAWGIGCAKSELPGVYVNVASYVPFIRQYVRF